MLSRTPISEAAFDQLCEALKAEIQELRDVAQQRYHDVVMPSSARPLMYRAEQRAQILEKVETLKAEWHTSTVVTAPVNLVELNPSRLRPRKSGVLIRHIKGVSDKVAAECLGVDVKQIRVWLESGALVGYQPTGGNWKIPRAEISSFAKRRRSES